MCLFRQLYRLDRGCNMLFNNINLKVEKNYHKRFVRRTKDISEQLDKVMVIEQDEDVVSEESNLTFINLEYSLILKTKNNNIKLLKLFYDEINNCLVKNQKDWKITFSEIKLGSYALYFEFSCDMNLSLSELINAIKISVASHLIKKFSNYLPLQISPEMFWVNNYYLWTTNGIQEEHQSMINELLKIS